jgi:hypothetical protein
MIHHESIDPGGLPTPGSISLSATVPNPSRHIIQGNFGGLDKKVIKGFPGRI